MGDQHKVLICSLRPCARITPLLIWCMCVGVVCALLGIVVSAETLVNMKVVKEKKEKKKKS